MKGPPDVLLERYLAGDLSPEERRRLEVERDASPALRARLETLAAERRAFLAADPPQAFAHRLVTRLAHESEPKVGRRAALAWVAPTAALAFGMVGVIIYTQFGDRPGGAWRAAPPSIEQAAPPPAAVAPEASPRHMKAKSPAAPRDTLASADRAPPRKDADRFDEPDDSGLRAGREGAAHAGKKRGKPAAEGSAAAGQDEDEADDGRLGQSRRPARAKGQASPAIAAAPKPASPAGPASLGATQPGSGAGKGDAPRPAPSTTREAEVVRAQAEEPPASVETAVVADRKEEPAAPPSEARAAAMADKSAAGVAALAEAKAEVTGGEKQSRSTALAGWQARCKNETGVTLIANLCRTRSCFSLVESPKQGAPFRYDVILSWTTKSDGSVSEPRLDGPKYLLGSRMAACTAKAMLGWRFAPASEETRRVQVQVPVELP